MPDPVTAPRNAPPDFRLRLAVETPEHVVVDYELAGLGSRALACVIDTAIILLLILAILFVSGSVAMWFRTFSLLVVIVLPFALLWGYFALFEGLQQGQTPGKRLLGLRVIRDTGHPITMREALARNLLRLADFLPPPYLLGIVMIAVHPRAKRLGDVVAGTVVVRDRPIEPLGAGFGDDGARVHDELGPPVLNDAEFRLLREFAERASALDAEIRARFAARIVAAVGDRFPTRHAVDVTFLTDLYRDEVARRKGRYGARVAGTTQSSEARSVAERLIARKGARWREFGALAERAMETGLSGLEASELPGFAERYREVAADFARARTYGADPRTTLRLERLVAAGHNLLYRDDRHTWRRMVSYVMDECPAAVVGAWRVVAVCFLVFSLSASGGYRLLRDRPAIAEEVLPAVMLQRAAIGVEDRRAGRGYAEAEREARPALAARIITNNIGVAFTCFATGIFFGIGSLVAIAYNGLQLGAISGHFQNVGLLAYLWTFVAGHGVLELFAIFVAGAAGFLLGRGLIAPGDYTRRDALVLQGRRAVPMVSFAIVLLLIAGTLEGFVSTSGAAVAARLTITVLSIVFLTIYLWRGARAAKSASLQPAIGAPESPA